MVIDWVDNLILNETLEEGLAGRVQSAFDATADGNAASSVARVLPSTVIGFELVDAARGGGHSEGGITLFIDMAADASSAD